MFNEVRDMSQRINTVIVGGGLAGLAISYYLKQEGRGMLCWSERLRLRMHGAMSAGIRSRW